MKTTEDLRAALNYQLDSTPGDPAALIARGRRQRASRRMGLAMAASAGAVVAVVLVSQVVGPMVGPGATTLPKAEAPATPVELTRPNPVLVAAVTRAGDGPSTPIVAPTLFDPLVRTLHLGWVPEHLVGDSALTSIKEQTYAASDLARDQNHDLGLVVTVLATGRPLTDFATGALGLPRETVRRATDPINGRPAECLSEPAVPGSCAALLWQYAPGAWARVSYSGTAGPTAATAAAVARKVAESVTLTAGEPVRLPFTVTGRTAQLVAVRTMVRFDPDGLTWHAELELAQDARDTPDYRGSAPVSISATRSTDPSGRTEKDDQPNTTIDGHKAALGSHERSLTVWGVHGIRMFVMLQPEYHGKDSVREIYGDTQVVPAPTDPTTWKSAR